LAIQQSEKLAFSAASSQQHLTLIMKIKIGLEFCSKTITVNKQKIKLQLWDTAG
jgi:GTPase SAR1 family protein